MRAKVSEENKAITILRAKVKVAEYPENIFKNGLFNPICPSGYNFLTGITEHRENVLPVRINYNSNAKVNGARSFNNY